MGAIIIDVVLCILIYSILMLFIIISNGKSDGSTDADGDDGGLPVSLPPDIDLPPGVCLPDDPRRHQITEPEEIFA